MGGQTGPVFYIYYEGMRHPPPYSHTKEGVWFEQTKTRTYDCTGLIRQGG